MSTTGGGSDDESDDEFNVDGSSGSRYPVHDCCEFEDVDSLRRLIFVPQEASDNDDSSQSSSSSSSTGNDEDSSSDDNDSHAAAHAAAIGHSPESMVRHPATVMLSVGATAAVAAGLPTIVDEPTDAAVAGSASEDGRGDGNGGAVPGADDAVGSGSKAGATMSSEHARPEVGGEGETEPPNERDAVRPSGSGREEGASDGAKGGSAGDAPSQPGSSLEAAARPSDASRGDGANAGRAGEALRGAGQAAAGVAAAGRVGPSEGVGPVESAESNGDVDREKLAAGGGQPAQDGPGRALGKQHQQQQQQQQRQKKRKARKQPTHYCPYDLNERDDDENTPIHVAIHARKLDHVRLLLKAGASVHRKCDGSAPVHLAISLGGIPHHAAFALDCVAALRDHGADLSVRDDAMHTPLYLACVAALPAIAAVILADAAGMQTLNAKADRVGGRALHAAARFDCPPRGGLGAAPSRHRARSSSSSSAAAAMGSSHRGHALPGMHDHHARMEHGSAAQRAVSAIGAVERARAGAGAPQRPDARGIVGVVALTQILLATPGIEIDPQNNYGRTPLHVAAIHGNWAVARLLLQHGANAHLLDRRGYTPGQLAQKRGMVIPNDLLPIIGRAAGHVPSIHAPSRDLIMDPDSKTVIMCHELCSRHMSCPPITREEGFSDPPPENVRRLRVLLHDEVGILRCGEFHGCSWEAEARRASIADVLKVHEYGYVETISQLCSSLPDHPKAIAPLDADTAVSRWSFEAAMRAAGSVCEAVDKVMSDDFRNAFCAIRPPGHHAGPRGIVTCANDPDGSHGFCLLNNVAIGAAYARNMYRNDGIRRVAIIDFDVHHGNGTEEIVRQLVPNVERAAVRTPFATGMIETSTYRPWLDENDIQDVFFASTHGYGPRDLRFADHPNPAQGGWFYPASGKTRTTDAILSPSGIEHPNLADFLHSQTWTRMGEDTRSNCCKIINVGLDLPRPHDVPGMQRVELRDSYRKKILPHLLDFDPDMIFISAGFDAHKKDSMNFGYVGMVEDDYEWVTEQLVKVANTCCNGRIISVLEGGYKIHGGIVSPFARSVASHVRALVDGGSSRELYDKQDGEWESQFERHLVEEKERRRQMKIEKLRPPIDVDMQRLHNTRFHHLPSDAHVRGLRADSQEDMEAFMRGTLEAQPRHAAAQFAAAKEGRSDDEDEPSRKRRRNHVDYKQLYEQMKKEELAG